MVNKEYSQVLTKDNEGFFRFIVSTMNNCGITTEQLTCGLCDTEEWDSLLAGEYLDKLMMSRLLGRLGCRGARCDRDGACRKNTGRICLQKNRTKKY